METARSPYLLDNSPTSVGRVLLARGFEQYCALHWGLSGEEIASALNGDGDAVGRVRGAADLFGGLLARGAIRSWTRPLGGGDPAPLRDAAWELDDFTHRFATSAIDPKRPFDGGAVPTHWIFADLADWNRVLEASVADSVPRRQPSRAVRPSSTSLRSENEAEVGPPREERLVRLPEITRRTGLSRSAIYRRIESGRFPGGIPLSGNVTVWRESEVDRWVSDPS